MKTNQIMTRKMGSFEVKQRTKDGMFNATELLKQWNDNPLNKKKELPSFFKMKSTKEFIKTIEEENDNMANSPYLKTRGKNGGTLMHPYLFIDFAMWLNPKFKLQVIKFVYDELIKNRNEAGNLYKGLAKSVAKFNNVDYVQLAKALNYIVFGFHKSGIRQKSSEKQLKLMNEIQKNLSFACDMELINSFDQLMLKMREMYHNKWDKIFLTPNQKLPNTIK